MKKLNLLLIFLIATFNTRAQFGYKFSYVTGSVYTPLTGTTTDANEGRKWNLNNYSIPLDFSYKLGPDVLDHFNVLLAFMGPASTYISYSTTPLNTFAPLGSMMLSDRGNLATTLPSLSLAHYKTEGTTPNRIFKLEFRGAGIYNEFQRLGTMDDSLSFQFWLYETTDVIEFHYGPAHLAHFFDYGDDGLAFSYYQNLQMVSGSIDYSYALSGDPSSPVLDSVEGGFDPRLLSDYPAEGTVYRFTPYASAAGIQDPELKGLFHVFPSIASTTLFISNKNSTKTNYEVLAVNGQKMNKSGSFNMGNNTLDIQSLPAGMYLLRVNTDKGTAAYRFSKQ